MNRKWENLTTGSTWSISHARFPTRREVSHRQYGTVVLYLHTARQMRGPRGNRWEITIILFMVGELSAPWTRYTAWFTLQVAGMHCPFLLSLVMNRCISMVESKPVWRMVVWANNYWRIPKHLIVYSVGKAWLQEKVTYSHLQVLSPESLFNLINAMQLQCYLIVDPIYERRRLNSRRA